METLQKRDVGKAIETAAEVFRGLSEVYGAWDGWEVKLREAYLRDARRATRVLEAQLRPRHTAKPGTNPEHTVARDMGEPELPVVAIPPGQRVGEV